MAIACPPELAERIAHVLGEGRQALPLPPGSDPALTTGPAGVPAVVILALSSSLNGDEARIVRLTRSMPGTAVVAVAAPEAVQRAGALRRLLRAGVKGIVTFDELDATLELTLDVVLSGELCLPPGLREELARPALSHREKEILMLVAEGFTNSEIASRLFLSESTVKSHLTASFRKLQVSSRAEAARRALEQAGRPTPSDRRSGSGGEAPPA